MKEAKIPSLGLLYAAVIANIEESEHSSIFLTCIWSSGLWKQENAKEIRFTHPSVASICMVVTCMIELCVSVFHTVATWHRVILDSWWSWELQEQQGFWGKQRWKALKRFTMTFTFLHVYYRKVLFDVYGNPNNKTAVFSEKKTFQ